MRVKQNGMNDTDHHDERISKMLLSSVYPHYVSKVEKIENLLTREVRYLNKLADELAKGRKIEKILRVS